MRAIFTSTWFGLIVLAAGLLGAAATVFPGRRQIALDAFVLFLGALGLVGGVRATRSATPDVHASTLDDELADPLDALPERPAELARLEREVYLSCGSSFYLHHRLRPLLREVAGHRLLMRHGVDLDKRPESAERILGATAWSWLRPDRAEPRDRWAPGPPLAELTAVVDAIETI
jgi:hypothetical protein